MLSLMLMLLPHGGTALGPPSLWSLDRALLLTPPLTLMLTLTLTAGRPRCLQTAYDRQPQEPSRGGCYWCCRPVQRPRRQGRCRRQRQEPTDGCNRRQRQYWKDSSCYKTKRTGCKRNLRKQRRSDVKRNTDARGCFFIQATMQYDERQAVGVARPKTCRITTVKASQGSDAAAQPPAVSTALPLLLLGRKVAANAAGL